MGDIGVGKMIIFDVIMLVFYGWVVCDKDVYKEVMSYGVVECYVELEFVVDDDCYLVSWWMYCVYYKIDGNFLVL